jgi:hypothetical protein
MRRSSVLLATLAGISLSCGPPPEPAHPAPPAARLEKSGGTERFGNSFLRSRQGVLEARFAGRPYERGYARGRLAYAEIAEGEKELQFVLHELVPGDLRRWFFKELLAASLRQSLDDIPAAHLEEISGLADAEQPDPVPGSWSPWERQLSLHALHDFSQRFIDTVPLSGACTGFAAGADSSTDGHVYLARNFDFEAGECFDRDKIVAAVVPERGNRYLTVTFGGFTGVVTGFNERGLGLSLQALSGGPTQSAGEPASLLAADILQYDSTVEQAIARIRSARVLVSDIYLLADASGTLAAVEKTPKRTGVRRGVGLLGATNSPETAEISAEMGTPPRTSTSLYREKRLRELLSRVRGDLDPAAAAAILRDRRGVQGVELGPGNRNAIDAFIACHSAVLDLTARRAYVAAFPHALGNYVCFDLALLSQAAPEDRGFEDLNRLALPEDPYLVSGGYAAYKKARASNLKARQNAIGKHYGEALRQSSEALELAPDFVEALAGRAAVEMRLREFGAAETDFARALALFPGPPDFAAEIERFRLRAEAGRPPDEAFRFPLSLEDLIEENRGR